MSVSSPPLTIIEAKKGWRLIDWRELWAYKDLFYFLVLRDVKVLYKQTVLGFGWPIIRPVFSMMPGMYFSTAITNSSSSLVGSTSMFTKVYFPRLVIPMTPVLAGLLDFGPRTTS